MTTSHQNMLVTIPAQNLDHNIELKKGVVENYDQMLTNLKTPKLSYIKYIKLKALTILRRKGSTNFI